jgi:hypothetical protein
MVSSSSLIFSPVFSAIVKLTDEFTSLEEPTDDPDIAIVLISLANGSVLLDLKGELNPKI